MEGRGNIVVKKVLRSPSVKRKSKVVPLSEKVTLEKVLGLTVGSSAALSTDPNTGTIAYPAGCVVVLYNPKLKRQQFICNSSKKTITCLAFSGDGKHLVTGESGHQPCVRVYEHEDHNWNPIADFSGHKFGISVVAFSPNLKHIVSIGTQHDMTVYVWNWKTKSKVASNKIASKVTGIAFNKDGSYFVTVGNRHVKFWYLDANKSRVNETVPLMGRSGLLGDQKNNYFCGASCGKGQMTGSTYVITQSGLLCEFNSKRLLEKWVELRTSSANCIAVSEQYIYIGCADGIVRIFSPFTMQYVTSLPRPHYLGVDVQAAVNPAHTVPTKSDVKYPDTIAISLDEQNKKITCVYNDHSLYIWDITDVRRIGKSKSMLAHSACIWGLEVYPNLDKGVLPNGSFMTCSEDDTIRLWNVDQPIGQDNTYRRNIYSNDLLKTLYIDPNLNNLLDIEFNPAGKIDKTDTTFQEKSGVRSIKVSPDGKHLASGDRVGNIRVHDLEFMEQVFYLEAHDSEVLSLEFTKPEHGVKLLTSAGRDRLLHVFDCEQDYGLVQTLDDHSAAITAIRFAEDHEKKLKMITCGADKSILFRNAVKEPQFQFVLNRHLVAKTTLYDMDIDPTGKFVATACQDRNVRIYNVKNGKQKRSYSGSTGTEGTLIRVELDPSGSYVATSCADKNLCIMDFFTGELLASMSGHSEIVTGVKFTNDLRHVISVSGDSCIFIWRLPYEFTVTMQNRLAGKAIGGTEQIPAPLSPKQQIRRGTFLVNNDKTDNNANIPVTDHKPDFRFSIGQLPGWAKKQVSLSGPQSPPEQQPASFSLPKGRWAQKAGEELVVKSMLDESSIHISLNDALDRRRNDGNARVSIINDDDIFNKDDEDDDDFCPTHSSSFTAHSPSTSSLTDEEEEEEETNDIVYYPQSNFNDLSESSNSFHVFGGRPSAVKDTGSETTEAASLSDDDMESSHTATTPLDEPSHDMLPAVTPDQEKFLKDNFEALSTQETFLQKLENLEENVNNGGMLYNSRSSISTRFLSRAQQQHLNNIASQQSVIAQANQKSTKPDELPFTSKKKSTIDPARRRTLGTPNEQPQRPSSTSSSSSRRQTLANSIDENPEEEAAVAAAAVVNTPERRRWGSVMPPSRKWKSMFDVSEEDASVPRRASPAATATRSRTPGTERKEQRAFSPARFGDAPWTSSPLPRLKYKPRPRTNSTSSTCSTGSTRSLPRLPTSRSTSQERPFWCWRRTVSTMEVTPEPVTPRTHKTSEDTNKRRHMTRQHSYLQATTSSKAKDRETSGAPVPVPSNSTLPTTRPVAAAVPTTAAPVVTAAAASKKTPAMRRSRLSAGMKAKFKSSPDLASSDVEPSLSVPGSSVSSVDDLEMPSSSAPTKKASTSRSSSSSRSGARRSMPATREPKEALSVRSSDDRDRLAMPPPPQGFVPPDSSTARKASAPELTLAQAKEILLGKSQSGQRKSEVVKKDTSLDRRTRLRNKSPSRQLPSTPLSNGVITSITTSSSVNISLSNGSSSASANDGSTSIRSPVSQRRGRSAGLLQKATDQQSPVKLTNDESPSKGPRESADSLDETPVKESRDPHVNASGSLSGALTNSPVSRPSHLNLHIPREGSPDEMSKSTSSVSRSSQGMSAGNRLSRAFSPLKSILKGGKKKDKEITEPPVVENKGEPPPVDILGNLTWKKSESPPSSVSPPTKASESSQSRLSRNREMLSKVLSSPPLPSTAPPTTISPPTALKSSPNSSISSSSSPPSTSAESVVSSPPPARSHWSAAQPPSSQPEDTTGTPPWRRANQPPSSAAQENGETTPPRRWSNQPLSSPPAQDDDAMSPTLRRWTNQPPSSPPAQDDDAMSPTSRRWANKTPSSPPGESAAAEARDKWDLALQQQRSQSPRRPTTGALLTFTVATASSAMPATSSPLSVMTVASSGASTTSSAASSTASIGAAVAAEADEVIRYDKSRQSPPISLSTTVTKQMINSPVVLSRPASSVVPPTRQRTMPTDDEDAVAYAVEEIQSIQEFIAQLPDLCQRLKDQDSASSQDQLIPSLMSLKSAIEKVPGCEAPPPPNLEPVLGDFRSNILAMMDRLTEQVRQQGDGVPPKEITKL